MEHSLLNCSSVKKTLFSVLLSILAVLPAFSQQTLWVGESYTYDVGSSVIGITANLQWSTSGGYISLSGTGFYRTITVTQYFSGTATVTCEWDYKLTGNDRYTHTRRQVTISCRDNPVSIMPTELTLAPGETASVGYRHQFDNQYTRAANAYFQSTNPSIASVNEHTGEVVAHKAGTAYINVYSKISSTSPYCKVTVKEVNPTSVSLQKTLSIAVGEQKTLVPNLYPSNAKTSFSWSATGTAASVSSSGVVTGKAVGKSRVTVKTANGLSDYCDVSVSKGKPLYVTASLAPGVYKKGSIVSLSTTDNDALIRYTIDGSIPTKSSTAYTSPITLDKSVTLKARAFHPEHEDGPVLTCEYDVTSLEISECFPYNGFIGIRPLLIPYIKFSHNVKIANAAVIKLKDGKGKAVKGEFVAGGNTLWFAPTEPLSPDTYTFDLPVSSLTSDVGVNFSHQYTFTLYDDFPKVCKVSSKGYFFLALKEDGTLWAWGENSAGQLGDGTTTGREEPVMIMDNVCDISAGWLHSFAIKNDGSLWGWGWNEYGQLGVGSTAQICTEPVKVMDDVSSVSAGYYHSLAIKKDGSLYSWGSNEYGELGNGTNALSRSPIKVMESVCGISAGSRCSFAIQNDGSLYSWGMNSGGILGDGTSTNRKLPVKIMSGVCKICTNDGHTLAVKDDGSLWAFGRNNCGALGNGTTTSQHKPVKIMDDVLEASAGDCHSVAIKTDNSLWAWGYNHVGELGDGTTEQRNSPVKIMDDVVAISAGCMSSLAVKSDGSLMLSGYSFSREEDDGGIWYYNYQVPHKMIDGLNWANSGRGTRTLAVPIGKQRFAMSVMSFSPYNASYETIEWKSLDTAIATVDEYGIVTGVKKGSTTVICNVTANGNTFPVEIRVQVQKPVDNAIEHVEIDADSPIQVYDLLGTRVYEGLKAEMPQLPHGVYIIRQGANSIKILL